MLYNICYGLGFDNQSSLVSKSPRYLLGYKRHLDTLASYIKSTSPHIVGLVEVDMGSHRSAQINQAEYIADALGHYSIYACKYSKKSIHNYLPILRKQGNAFLAAESVHGERFHYFDHGVKRLIIELEMQDYAIFLVHLSLQALHRRLQLRFLQELIEKTHKPVIVAGDLNTFKGTRELTHFLHVTGMQSANTKNLKSFPSWQPRRELDFILYQDGININHFEIPDVRYSDHLPLICDFSLR